MSDKQGLEAIGGLFGKVLMRPLNMPPPREEPGDFRDADGFLCCSICGGRKEMVVNILGHDMRVTCQCHCEPEWMRQNRRIQEEDAKRRLRQRIEELRKIGITSDAYSAMRFEKDNHQGDGRALDMAMNYVRNWRRMRDENAGLLLYGRVGCGKTFIAACIVNWLIDHGVPAMIATAPDLIEAMRGGYDSPRASLLYALKDADLVVIDDYGTEQTTGYTEAKLFELINARYLAQKPLIITTNLTPAQIMDTSTIHGARIADRIKQMCTPVQVRGQSLRADIAQDKQKALREVLGI